jgi:ankyrin repeat protein
MRISSSGIDAVRIAIEQLKDGMVNIDAPQYIGSSYLKWTKANTLHRNDLDSISDLTLHTTDYRQALQDQNFLKAFISLAKDTDVKEADLLIVLQNCRRRATPADNITKEDESDGNILVEPLLGRGVNCHIKDESGKPALVIAAESGSDMAVESLLRFGADPNVEDSANRTALYYALINGYEDIAKLLLLHPDIRFGYGVRFQLDPPLPSVWQNEHWVVVRTILDLFPMPEDVILWAVNILGEVDVNRFVDIGFPNPNIDLSNLWDSRVLEAVVLRRKDKPTWSFDTKEKIVKILVAHYANIYNRSLGHRHMTLLSLVAAQGRKDMLHLLINLGADVTSLRPQYRIYPGNSRIFWNPLQSAAAFKNLENVRMLLSHRADPSIEAPLPGGKTALHYAAMGDEVQKSEGERTTKRIDASVEIIELLVRGQDASFVNAEDARGWTALDIAESVENVPGYEKVVEALVGHNGKPGSKKPRRQR